MTWIKLDDKTPRHPKVAVLSDRAFRVWFSALCYASEFLTDGLLPVAFLITVKRSIQDELITCGLWQVNADASVEIHDYLEHQRDKASARRHLTMNAARQKRHRNAVTDALRNADRNAKVTLPDKSREDQVPPIAPQGGRRRRPIGEAIIADIDSANAAIEQQIALARSRES